jgi:PncC family amidohydrolase
MDNSAPGFESELLLESRRIAEAAARSGLKIAVAESCTGGLVAASLTRVPGASDWFCGSSVVYQEPTKIGWLNVSHDLIVEHSAESAQVTEAMSRAILEVTPHADVSVATSGHLEPNASHDRPGPYVFVCVSQRDGVKIKSARPIELSLSGNSRGARQQSAAIAAIRKLFDFLNRQSPVTEA